MATLYFRMSSKHEQKYCPRCKQVFECKKGSITQCQCSGLQLDEKALDYIERKYNDCLCLNCLKEINHDLCIEQS
jgi:hypothetical protein